MQGTIFLLFIMLGDALSIFEHIPNASIDFCMTSPPYWNKRQYHNGGIGLEKNYKDCRQIFIDCLHLLTLHEPGNELHIVPEISIPGGNVDYFLVSVRNKEIKDFVGIELQTLDTTGTIWPERQRFVIKEKWHFL